MELILENQTLPADKSMSSMQNHQTLMDADSKKTRRSSSTFQQKMKDELIPLHPKSPSSKEKVCKFRIPSDIN